MRILILSSLLKQSIGKEGFVLAQLFWKVCLGGEGMATRVEAADPLPLPSTRCSSDFPFYLVLDSSLWSGATHNQGGSSNLNLLNLDNPSQIYSETNLI